MNVTTRHWVCHMKKILAFSRAEPFASARVTVELRRGGRHAVPMILIGLCI